MSTINSLLEDEHFNAYSTEQWKPIKDIISNEQCVIFQWVNYVVLATLVGLVGIVTNIMNVIVFYQQGFNTTTNICFFSLAISDLTCLITGELFNICINPYVDADHIPFIAKEIGYLLGAWLHVCNGRITSWITVFITAERCFGVAMPLKVKQIITPRRTTISMVFIFIVHNGMLLPEYSIGYWGWKFLPSRNRSFLGHIYKSDTGGMYGLVHILTSYSGIVAFLAIICLTAFLVAALNKKSIWRKSATGGTDTLEKIVNRDKKTMKMIIMIASILIICYTPGTSLALVTAFEPEFKITGAYKNSLFSFWSIAWVFNHVNSSVNIFLYYNMSTKYRKTFNELFCKERHNY